MFDKILFDRNAYDRSVAEDVINVTMSGTGRMRTNIVVAYPVPINDIHGIGNLNGSRIIMQLHLTCSMDGNGDLTIESFPLRIPLHVPMYGRGYFNPGIAAQTPIVAELSGSGDLKSTSDFVKQHMIGTLRGNGIIFSDLVIRTPMRPFVMSGIGNLQSTGIRLWIAMSSQFNGEGNLILRRLGALNESLLELDGINLSPGEEVTIDTDLLSVFFGFVEDVSSITSDSVFFDLYPGENVLTIETDTNEPLVVTAIWNNRWL